MAQYLIQIAYTPEAWAAMVKDPQNRMEKVAPAIEAMGGKFVDAWLSFGEYDLIGILEMPDNVSAAAFSLAVAAGGACKAYHTTPLMSMEEGVQAMKKAQGSTYKPATKG